MNDLILYLVAHTYDISREKTKETSNAKSKNALFSTKKVKKKYSHIKTHSKRQKRINEFN